MEPARRRLFAASFRTCLFSSITSLLNDPRLRVFRTLLAEQPMRPSIHEMDAPAGGAIHDDVGIARRVWLVVDPLLNVECCIRALIEFGRHDVTLPGSARSFVTQINNLLFFACERWFQAPAPYSHGPRFCRGLSSPCHDSSHET
jgi:hypothetical protein